MHANVHSEAKSLITADGKNCLHAQAVCVDPLHNSLQAKSRPKLSALHLAISNERLARWTQKQASYISQISSITLTSPRYL